MLVNDESYSPRDDSSGSDDDVRYLLTIEVKAYKEQLKRLKSRKNLKTEENKLLAKLIAATENEAETYLFTDVLIEDTKTDYLIISRLARLVVTIVKDEAASESMKQKLAIFLRKCSFEPEKFKWRHLSVIYQRSDTVGCKSCKLGRIGPDHDFSKWWVNVKNTSWKNTDSEDGFDSLLKFFVTIIFRNPDGTYLNGEELFFKTLHL
jgi:hypothetical protein